jgi:hypothetical protein
VDLDEMIADEPVTPPAANPTDPAPTAITVMPVQKGAGTSEE